MPKENPLPLGRVGERVGALTKPMVSFCIAKPRSHNLPPTPPAADPPPATATSPREGGGGVALGRTASLAALLGAAGFSPSPGGGQGWGLWALPDPNARRLFVACPPPTPNIPRPKRTNPPSGNCHLPQGGGRPVRLTKRHPAYQATDRGQVALEAGRPGVAAAGLEDLFKA